jgi:integrase
MQLRPDNIDLDRAIVRVPASMMKNGVGQVYRIGPDAVTALRAIWDENRERVFPASRDGSSLFDHFRAILKTAGLTVNQRNRMSLFHKVRRTAVTLTAANAGIAEAIALAGHSGPEVNRRYIDPSMLPQHDSTRWLPQPAPPPQ